MKFELEIEMGNEAMSDYEDAEMALRDVAERIADGYARGKIRDRNGNTVGSWKFAD